MILGSGTTRYTLSQGIHIYPFSYTLPIDVPSSFSGPYGSISYKLKAIIERPLFKFDYKDEVALRVISPIDFNRKPIELQTPEYVSAQKTVCSLFCNGGKIKMDVEIAKRAFVAGETIPLKVHVSNQSNRKVKELKVRLEKIVTYKVTYPMSDSKTGEFRIFLHRDRGVGAHGEHTFNLQLKIPDDVQVPNFSRCKLFRVGYVMKVSCKMPRCTLDLDAKMGNIQLGHIQRGSQQAGSYYSEMIDSRDRPQPSASVKTPKQESPPPSYNDYVKWDPTLFN